MRLPVPSVRDPARPEGGGEAASPPRVAVDSHAAGRRAGRGSRGATAAERAPQAQPELLSAGELARRLRVERPWVYRHRELLGGMRIGGGPKAPWRFDYETAVEAMRERQGERRTERGL